MPKRKVEAEAGRINLRLPPKLNKELNDYMIKYARKHGSFPHGLKSKIARVALEEWLERNKDNFDIKF